MKNSSGRAGSDKALTVKMAGLGVRESDIAESFIRASGPGGQHVNKASVGVYLRHIPTGIEVKCSGRRSQTMNRQAARKILLGKIEASVLRTESAERHRTEKLRRQKRRRPKAVKENILRSKKLHSIKKAMRHKVGIE